LPIKVLCENLYNTKYIFFDKDKKNLTKKNCVTVEFHVQNIKCMDSTQKNTHAQFLIHIHALLILGYN